MANRATTPLQRVTTLGRYAPLAMHEIIGPTPEPFGGEKAASAAARVKCCFSKHAPRTLERVLKTKTGNTFWNIKELVE